MDAPTPALEVGASARTPPKCLLTPSIRNSALMA